ncbi:MAG TPA: hypothetical protein VF947_09110 [Myxococcales bacterium]
MAWEKPAPRRVWQAIQLYLQVAYGGILPEEVAKRIAELKSASDGRFYDSAVFERDRLQDPTYFSLRLGNRIYPHAKLVIERSPDGSSALFQADTHDRHCCPEPTSPDYLNYRQLMEQNQRIAREVELAWAKEGLPTFRQFLRQQAVPSKYAN